MKLALLLLICLIIPVSSQIQQPRISVGDQYIYSQERQIITGEGAEAITETQTLQTLEDYEIVVDAIASNDVTYSSTSTQTAQSTRFDCIGNFFTIPDWDYWVGVLFDDYAHCEF